MAEVEEVGATGEGVESRVGGEATERGDADDVAIDGFAVAAGRNGKRHEGLKVTDRHLPDPTIISV